MDFHENDCISYRSICVPLDGKQQCSFCDEGIRSTLLYDKGVRIINYEVSPDEKWCLLAGGSANIEAKGIMQLFSIEKQGCQVLEGHAGTFTSLRIAEHSTAIQVLCFVGKKENQSPALHVVEITFLREPSFAFLHDGLQCLPRSIMISLSPFM